MQWLASLERGVALSAAVAVQTLMLLQTGATYLLLWLRSRCLPPCSQPTPDHPLGQEALLAVVVPCFNEAASLRAGLVPLIRDRMAQPQNCALIFVDNGSTDSTVGLLEELQQQYQGDIAIHVVQKLGGRGPAMMAGARVARGLGADALFFLHADCTPPLHFDRLVLESLRESTTLATCFAFRCDRDRLQDFPGPAGLSVMEWTVNLRARCFQLPFGDQGFGMTLHHFFAVGGMPEWPVSAARGRTGPG